MFLRITHNDLFSRLEYGRKINYTNYMKHLKQYNYFVNRLYKSRSKQQFVSNLNYPILDQIMKPIGYNSE